MHLRGVMDGNQGNTKKRRQIERNCKVLLLHASPKLSVKRAERSGKSCKVPKKITVSASPRQGYAKPSQITRQPNFFSILFNMPVTPLSSRPAPSSSFPLVSCFGLYWLSGM